MKKLTAKRENTRNISQKPIRLVTQILPISIAIVYDTQLSAQRQTYLNILCRIHLRVVVDARI